MKAMRYLIYMMGALSVLGFSGCVQDQGGFLMTYERDFSIPAGLNAVNTHYFEIYNIETNKDNYFDINNVIDPDQYEAHSNEGRIYLPLDPNVDLSFIQDIQVMVFKAGQTGLLPIAFERTDVPLTTDEDLLMLAQIPDLMSYLKEDKFNVRIRINLRSPSPQAVTARLRMSFRAQAK